MRKPSIDNRQRHEGLHTGDKVPRVSGKTERVHPTPQSSGRKQSFATAMRYVRGIARHAEQVDFTTIREDLALRTVLNAVRTMYTFLQVLSQDDSLCDCDDRSWRGEGHDSGCPVGQIATLLSELGAFGRNQYYVLFIKDDVEPYLHGPFATEAERDDSARKLRAEDDSDPKSGIYRLDCTPAPRVDSYSGAFFPD